MTTPMTVARHPSRQRTAGTRGALQRGFTLIEVMVVTGVIGVLAAIAAPAYSEYVDSANLARLHTHFEEAVRLVQADYAKHQSAASLGIIAGTPESSAEWVALLNSGLGQAPGGGAAYVVGAGDGGTGAIGIVESGSLPAGDAQVVVVLPAYGGNPGGAKTITYTGT